MTRVRTDHGHYSNDILRADSPETPIDPNGGGGVLVTGSQGGSVAGATEFRAAGAVVDLGSGVAAQGLIVSLFGPFSFDWNSPLDLDGSWHTLLALDTGMIVLRTWATFDQDFDVADQAIQVSILSDGSHSHDRLLARYPLPTVTPTFNNSSFISEPASFGDVDASSGPHGSFGGPIVVARTGALLVASYEQFTPTQGQSDIYAIIATPAS